jgi:hypothetical protein
VCLLRTTDILHSRRLGICLRSSRQLRRRDFGCLEWSAHFAHVVGPACLRWRRQTTGNNLCKLSQTDPSCRLSSPPRVPTQYSIPPGAVFPGLTSISPRVMLDVVDEVRCTGQGEAFRLDPCASHNNSNGPSLNERPPCRHEPPSRSSQTETEKLARPTQAQRHRSVHFPNEWRLKRSQ